MTIRLRTGLIAVAAALSAVTLTLSPAAAASPSTVTSKGSIPLTAQECAAMRAKYPGAPCVMTITITKGPEHLDHPVGTSTSSVGPLAVPAQDSSVHPAALASSCTILWYTGTASINASAGVWGINFSLGYERDASCGYVEYKWETCLPWAYGWSVSVPWCGGYPANWQWNYWTQTNAGFNATASFLFQGFPLTVSRWLRGQVNGWNGNVSWTGG